MTCPLLAKVDHPLAEYIPTVLPGETGVQVIYCGKAGEVSLRIPRLASLRLCVRVSLVMPNADIIPTTG